ncbi:MAG: hypothetical protein JKX68_01465 [Flavobacteriales bacterium]|nr:hypothetical protein [Flavobacteriales bacterium]
MATLFKEKQKFTQILIWIFLIGITSFWLYTKFITFYLKEPFGNMQPTDNAFHFVDVIIGLLLLLFLTANLKTKFKDDGIYYKFFPLQWSYKCIKWSEVKSMEVRQYKPLKEYLGWGIRISTSGTAYNVKGNKGLQLILKNGKRILFGTQHPNKMREVIKNISDKLED